MRNTILCGDALTMLKTMPSNYVQMVCTSPPYYGLRDYNTETVYTLEGDPTCEHVWIHEGRNEDGAKVAQCQWCHAVKVDQQIGQEDTPQAYITRLVEVFREVRRVLREDGVLWLNLGDTYTSHSDTQVQPSGRVIAHTAMIKGKPMRAPALEGMKPKNLMMIPARVAIALQEDGWYLRSDVIWHKLNAMPESVTDRPTSAHEHIFLLAKSERYYYDADAIKEPVTGNTHSRGPKPHDMPKTVEMGKGIKNNKSFATATWYQVSERNKRNVWTVASQPYPESHFATFPPKLIEPCILAGSSPRACEHCGAAWERVTERRVPTFPANFDPTPYIGRAGMNRERIGKSEHRIISIPQAHIAQTLRQAAQGRENEMQARYGSKWNHWTRTDTSGARIPTSADWQDIRNVLGLDMEIETEEAIGWRPTCSCTQEGTGKCIVLDPFMGAGTTALVALQHGRNYLGIELNPTYIALAEKRIATIQPHLWTVEGISA